MKRLWITLAAVAMMVPMAAGQETSASVSHATPDASVSGSQGAGTPTMTTPGMSEYDRRLMQYMEPKLAVRRVAQERAAQRRARMAARQWYGYSNLRPTASPDPYHGEYAPRWGGNNSLYPNLWSGYGPSYVVLWPYSDMLR